VERLAPELAEAGDDLRDVELRLRETASALASFLASLEAEPDRLEAVEGELDRFADLRRRYRCVTTEELLERATAAREELAELEAGVDPVAAAAAAVDAAEGRCTALAAELGAARAAASDRFAGAVAEELRGIGMGDGEFHVELRSRDAGPTGGDEVAFLIRPNAGRPFAPVAETASGGELSRVALALAAVGGGETLVFDEIDAGIGGRTANAVAATLERLAARTQIVTITHLPQIASRAERHFRVEKLAGEQTRTSIAQLGAGERKDEIERMLGGEEFLSTVR
jgi:DNA repair protein RecN (Recombination protein N)